MKRDRHYVITGSDNSGMQVPGLGELARRTSAVGPPLCLHDTLLLALDNDIGDRRPQKMMKCAEGGAGKPLC